MRNLQITLETAAENLALDEALLAAAEGGEIDAAVLRLWELPTYCVVLGRSSEASVEVNLDACREDGIPVLRRSSGGGTILAGPGCLMYSLTLGSVAWPELQSIDLAHHGILSKMSEVLSAVDASVQAVGTSDLSILVANSKSRQKFSGNAMRMKRHHLLYHGTLLYDFDLSRIPRWLATPTRTPDYRDDREHSDFVTNLPVDRSSLTRCLLSGWQAEQALDTWPKQRTLDIVSSKYIDHPTWIVQTPAK